VLDLRAGACQALGWAGLPLQAALAAADDWALQEVEEPPAALQDEEAEACTGWKLVQLWSRVFSACAAHLAAAPQLTHSSGTFHRGVAEWR
jgi:hypothetical protein